MHYRQQHCDPEPQQQQQQDQDRRPPSLTMFILGILIPSNGVQNCTVVPDNAIVPFDPYQRALYHRKCSDDEGDDDVEEDVCSCRSLSSASLRSLTSASSLRWRSCRGSSASDDAIRPPRIPSRVIMDGSLLLEKEIEALETDLYLPVVSLNRANLTSAQHGQCEEDDDSESTLSYDDDDSFFKCSSSLDIPDMEANAPISTIPASPKRHFLVDFDSTPQRNTASPPVKKEISRSTSSRISQLPFSRSSPIILKTSRNSSITAPFSPMAAASRQLFTSSS